jgi:BASS family bile acid:Na+ symporter
LTVSGLVAIMLSMGLKVTFGEVLASVRNLRLTVLGLVANFALVPIVTIGLLYLFKANPMVSAGFLVLAVCPGAPVGPPFATIAKGDVPFAIGQMVILAGVSALLSPALLSILLTQILPASDLEIDYVAIVRTLLIAQLLPLGIGLGVHHWMPRFTDRINKPLGLIANVLLLSAVTLVLVKEYQTLGLIRTRGWFGMLLLLVASLSVGWLCGGPGQETRKSLSVTTGARNAAVALVIASKNFADTPAVTAVVADAMISIFGTLGCALLFARISRRTGQRTLN